MKLFKKKQNNLVNRWVNLQNEFELSFNFTSIQNSEETGFDVDQTSNSSDNITS